VPIICHPERASQLQSAEGSSSQHISFGSNAPFARLIPILEQSFALRFQLLIARFGIEVVAG
jgi:hypothetical protein